MMLAHISDADSYFNSQPHKEADSLLMTSCVNEKYFNSQPHKEADMTTWMKRSLPCVFQLTASQGG